MDGDLPVQGPTDAELARTRRALTSPTLCQVFQIVAGGTGGPSALAQALGRSKHAVSLQLAKLREAGLIDETPHPSGDARRKRYVPNWQRLARIFAHDHGIELDLFHDQLVASATDQRPPAGDPDRLVVTGTGRLLAIGEHRLEQAPDDEAVVEADQTIQATIEGFQRFFEVYLGARTYPTLREYLRGAYQELVRYADRLPGTPALASFARFQAQAFSHDEGVGQLLQRALAGTDGLPEDGPARSAPPERLTSFQIVGHETADGAYVLEDGAQAVIQQGLPIQVHASYVHRAEQG